MKCGIIKDLLPSYIDQLTCEDSNQEIEKHLAECQECSKYYRQMLPIEIEEQEAERDLDLLKSFRKKQRILIALVAAFVIAIAGIITVEFFANRVEFWMAVPYEYARGFEVEVFTERENTFEIDGESRTYYGQGVLAKAKMSQYNGAGFLFEYVQREIDGVQQDIVLVNVVTTPTQYLTHRSVVGELEDSAVWHGTYSLDDLDEVDMVYYMDRNIDFMINPSEEKVLEWIEKYGHLVWSKDMAKND